MGVRESCVSGVRGSLVSDETRVGQEASLLFPRLSNERSEPDRSNGWRYRALHTSMILGSPLLQLAINPRTFLDPSPVPAAYAGIKPLPLLDPWVYLGLFLDLPDFLQRFGHTYYPNRLASLLPGFLLHRLLPPLAASYTLHLGFLYALLFATYRLLASGANRHVAMLGTLLVAWSPSILAAIGWDYVDGAGIVFLVTTLLCIERGLTGTRPLAWFVASGAASVCLVVTNLTLIGLLLPCFVFFLLRRDAERGSIYRSFSAAAVGAAVALAAFASLHWILGGRGFFLAPSIRFALAYYGPPNQWISSMDWTRAVPLAVPLVAAVGGAGSLLKQPDGERAFARAVQATLLVAVGLAAFSDAFMHSGFLRTFFYTSYLAPLALLALPLQGDVTAPADLRKAVAIELLLLAGLVAVHGTLLWHLDWFERFALWGNAVRPPSPMMIVALVTGAGAGFAAVALRLARPSMTTELLFAAGMTVSCATPHLWLDAQARDARGDFQVTVAAHRFIASHIGHDAVRLWYRVHDEDQPPFRSIASTYLWGWVLVNEDLPQLTDAQAKTMRPDAKLVLLVSDESETVDARETLRRYGFGSAIIARQTFRQSGQSFSVVIADLVRLAS
jgi:hypothetical protein